MGPSVYTKARRGDEGVANATLSVYIRAVITIKRHTGPSVWLDALTYDVARHLRSGEPPLKVVGMTCHKKHFAILDDHEIADDGMVTPSVICPETGCDFHEMVTLEGWNKSKPDSDSV